MAADASGCFEFRNAVGMSRHAEHQFGPLSAYRLVPLHLATQCGSECHFTWHAF